MTDAAKIATIVDTYRGGERQQELFDIDDAIVAQAGIAFAGGKTSYLNGTEAVLNFAATRAANAALVAGAAITLGVLVASLRPGIACIGRGVCVTDTGARVAGNLTIAVNGTVTFVPDAAAGAGAGFVFHSPGVHVGPPATLVSEDVI